jgi:hypothetical protein
MIRPLSFLTLLLIMLLTGCAYHLHPFSPPTVVKLQLQSERPERYAVRVTAREPPSDYPVTPDDRVTFTVPPFRRGCSTYLFEVIRLSDLRPEHTRIVEVRREQRVVRKLSLSQIAKLSEDAAGYRMVKVKD